MRERESECVCVRERERERGYADVDVRSKALLFKVKQKNERKKLFPKEEEVLSKQQSTTNPHFLFRQHLQLKRGREGKREVKKKEEGET